MANIDFKKQLEEIVVEFKKSIDTYKKLDQNIRNTQAIIDYVRVGIKYLLFDLEATRRENKHLKELLEKYRG